jgi:non-homologous end joining protein Ku
MLRDSDQSPIHYKRVAEAEEKVASGGKPVVAKKPAAHRATNVVDLMDVLKRSLEESGAKKKTRKPPHGGRKKRQKAA